MIIINYYYYGGGLFTAFPKKMALHLLIKYIIVYLTDSHVTKEKERRKRKSEEISKKQWLHF